MRIGLLDVGHGSCLVAYGAKEAVVVDSPPGDTLVRFLRRNGVAVVRHVVITHADKDHCGGLVALLQSGIDVETIWILDDQKNVTGHYRRVVEAMRSARSVGNTLLKRGYPHSDAQPATWGKVRIEWLAPNHEDRMLSGERNTLSVGLRLVVGGLGVAVVLGDMDSKGYARLRLPRDLASQWLIAPHHGGLVGSETETQAMYDDLLSRTGARYVFFSIGRRRQQNPQPALLDWLRRDYGDCYVCCTQLSRNCSQDLPAIRRDRGSISRGARTSPIECCAGTVVLRLSADGMIWDGEANHKDLVDGIPSRLCSTTPRKVR